MSVKLNEKPFYLSQEEIAWVEQTIEAMSLEEKVGQLFVQMRENPEEASIRTVLHTYHQGGLRYPPDDGKAVLTHNRHYQQHSKIPLLIASNCDNGGDGACTDGTLVQTAAGAGASAGVDVAYASGYVAGKEAAAIGCNWVFNPCVDLFLNWRNTIINTRSFGNDPERVVACAKAYIDGVHQSNVACCCKHFPGDGVEERDQHLVLGVNDLSVENWENTFGKVYSGMIEAGAESIMVGHFALPAMSRKLVPGIQDHEIMPATLAPELVQGLLREQMGFNGLIITDASHMAGMANMMRRREAVPRTIAAGCDMILFSSDMEEDFHYMLDGVHNGTISHQRLKDALRRILGLKAKLKLHEAQQNGTLCPQEQNLPLIGCEAHRALAQTAADAAITLVKDTQHNLPIRPETHKRIKVYLLSGTPETRAYQGDPVGSIIREELERVGFEVTIADTFYDLEARYGVREENELLMTEVGSRKSFTEQFDAAFVWINVKGYAQENNVRIRWSCGHSNEVPWYATEVPTVGISLNYTTHLFELPQIRTFINAYNNTRTTIRQTIQKIMGNSPFQGTANETVFCDKWDTRL